MHTQKKGHGRRNRGFSSDDAFMEGWKHEVPTQEDFSVQLAPRGFLSTLLQELGDRTLTVYGRLVLARGKKPAYWAQNVWFNPVWIPIQSIGDAVQQLTSIQRNWRAHLPEASEGLSGRTRLIESKLPHMSCRALRFGAPVPTAPLGAFTLWNQNLLLAASHTNSPFPDGEVSFEENKIDPPGRAYLKLWEVFTVHSDRQPQPNELCLDLGASPGGWTWVLASLGARVFSIDKAPLAPHLSALPNVEHCLGSGFSLDPKSIGKVDWLCSDMICYPARLFELIQKWLDANAMRHAVCTLKFQSDTDWKSITAFAKIPGSQLLHLSCNKHELTWIWHEQEKNSKK